MRDLVALGFMLLYVPLAFSNAFAGYLLWGWAGSIALGAYLFGFMTNVPYVQIFALITMAALLLRRDPQALPFKMNSTLVLMILFVVHGFMCALLSYPGLPRNWELFGNVFKTVLFCALMPMVVVSRLRIHAMVIMLAMAVAFHGALDGLKFLSSGGGHNAAGISKFGDNNQFALVLAMSIPLLGYLFFYSRRWFMRLAFGGVALLIVFAVVATNSRGGLVGMAAVGAWIVLVGRHKIVGAIAIALAAGLVVYLAPQDWTDRMNTIQHADQDESFLGRVNVWKISSAIAVEHPVFGGGFRAVQSPPVWDKFEDAPGLLDFIETPRSTKSGRAAHSIWFEVLGDQGFVGFFLFIALLANAFWNRREILKLTRRRPEQLRWATDLADLLAAVLVVYMVSGSLLSAAYFEMPYIMVMMMMVLRLQVQREFESRAHPTP